MLTVLSLCLSTDFLFYPQIITEDNLVEDFHRFLSYPQILKIIIYLIFTDFMAPF